MLGDKIGALLRPRDRRLRKIAALATADAAIALAKQHQRNGQDELVLGALDRALDLDPSHVEARAELGSLRFKPPHQPLVDEIRRRHQFDLCEVIVEVRNPCNYRCYYCVAKGHNNESVKSFDLGAIERTMRSITQKIVVTSLECGGGEPTVHPQFADLMRVCAGRGAVSFPTNNSQDPKRWLPIEGAGRLVVRATLHPEGEHNISRYIQYAQHLIDAGCHFTSRFVAHPDRIAKIADYRRRFSEAGIAFSPIPFIGEYEGRSYPNAYTESEKEIIGLRIGETSDTMSWYQKIQPATNRIRNFRGIPCLAGYKSIYLACDGRIRRCLYDARALDEPLKAAKPCGVKTCGCGLFLEKLNLVETPEFYNDWAHIVGDPLLETSWLETAARGFGYASSGDGIAKESVRMYDELMRAYGKDDHPER